MIEWIDEWADAMLSCSMCRAGASASLLSSTHTYKPGCYEWAKIMFIVMRRYKP